MKYHSKKIICIIISVMILLSSFSLGIMATNTVDVIEDYDYNRDYFIKNSASNLYLNVLGLAELNQASFTGTSEQAWILTECNTGYYTIMNKSTGTYLTAPSELGYGEYVLLESYLTPTNTALNAHERQLWSFTELENGKYLIQSMSMVDYDLYLSHNDYMGLYGYSVVIDPYELLDTEYASYLEWEIHDYTTADFDYRLLAYDEPHLCYCSRCYCSSETKPEDAPCNCDDNCPCSDLSNDDPCTVCENRDVYLEPTAELLFDYKEYMNKTIFTYFYKEMSKTTMADLLTDCELFIIHTHGAPNWIQIDSINTNADFFYIEDFNNLDLSNLKLAVLLTCSTAEGYDETNIEMHRPTNVVEKMICQGAETVIGFRNYTLIADCNDFIYALMKELVDYNSISIAIDNINYDDFDSNFESSLVVAGNENLILT